MHPSKKGTKAGPKPLTAAQDQMLEYVETYFYLTAEQIATLCSYSPGSLNWVRAQLKALCEEGWLYRVPLRSAVGNAVYVYRIGPRGMRRLAALEGDDEEYPRRFRRDEEDDRDFFFLLHNVRLADAFVAAEQLPQLDPRIELVQSLHDLTLRHTPVQVKVVPSRESKKPVSITVVPDGFLEFALHDGRDEASVLLEIDRGRHFSRKFKKKLRALVAYTAVPSGPYYAFFGVKSVSIAFATTKGQHRVEQMRTWCEQVLEELGKANDRLTAQSFLFTAIGEGPAPIDPIHFFLQKVWQQPFSAACTSLLPL